MFFADGSSGRVGVGVQMGVMTVANFEAAVASGGLFNAEITNFVSGNAFASTAVINANGIDNPELSVAGVDADSVALDSANCSTAALGCTVLASITANPLDKSIMVSGGENVTAFAGMAIADLNIAGIVMVDGLNSMHVTPGAGFTLIGAASVPEPATLLLLGFAFRRPFLRS